MHRYIDDGDDGFKYEYNSTTKVPSSNSFIVIAGLHPPSSSNRLRHIVPINHMDETIQQQLNQSMNG